MRPVCADEIRPEGSALSPRSTATGRKMWSRLKRGVLGKQPPEIHRRPMIRDQDELKIDRPNQHAYSDTEPRVSPRERPYGREHASYGR